MRNTRPPFQERKSAVRPVLDAASGCYPAFVFGGKLARGIVPVFHFHDATKDYLEPYLRYLSENGYQTATSQTMADIALRGTEPPAKTVVLCFDDAWASVWTVLDPLLEKYDQRAITYVIPGRVMDGPRRLQGEAAAEGVSPLATWDELAGVRDHGRIDIQAHTLSHAMVYCGDDVLGFVAPDTRTTLLSRPALSLADRPQFLGLADLGTPYFARRSRMSDARRYVDSDAQREACVAHVRERGGAVFFEKRDWQRELREAMGTPAGRYETDEEREASIRNELTRCRDVLGERLGIDARQICMPWAICGSDAERWAIEAGYETVVADRLFGKRYLSRRSRPTRLMRLKHEYIFTLPGRGRRSFRSLRKPSA